MPQTVVHIASGDLWAGAEVQLYNLAMELHDNAQIHLLVILLNHGILESRLKEAGINVTIFDEKELSSAQILFRICTFLKKHSPEIVHTHRQKENILGGLATLLCSNAKSVRTVHGAAESKPGLRQVHKQLFRFLDWLVGRLLQDKIVAVSIELKDRLSHRYPATKIVVVENGINLDELQNSAAERVELPGPVDAIKIAIVGRLVPVKRIDIFLRVAHALVGQHPGRYAFYIFGDGPLHDDIKLLSENLGIEHQVYLMRFKPNISGYLSKMNLLLITSDHEGLPMNLLEALSLRVPVVAHAVGGIPKVLHDGQLGTLVHSQDIQEYASVIANYTQDPQIFLQKAEAAYHAIANSYSSKDCAKRYIILYNTLTKRKHK
jgi:glycosyltransferase involved in cell wall biosynthesis